MLPGRPGQNGWLAKDNRLFINAVLWIAKTDAPWRDLPERFGKWNRVWKRFDRWSHKGIWKQVFEALASQDPDLEWLILDSTVIRTHQHAAEKKRGQTAEALGRSVGGFSTKIHAAVDGLGNPVRLVVTEGQVADVTEAEPTIRAHHAKADLGDKGYESDKVVRRRSVVGRKPSFRQGRIGRSLGTMISTHRGSVRRWSGSSAF